MWVKCMDYLTQIDISYTATAAERGRYEHNIKVLCISGEINPGPKRERPNWNEAVTKAENFAKEQWNREHIPIDLRQKNERHAGPESQGTLDIAEQKVVQLSQRD